MSSTVTTFGAPTSGKSGVWGRCSDGIFGPGTPPGGGPNDSNRFQGYQGDAWRGTFTAPSYQGSCLALLVTVRNNTLVAAHNGTFSVELFSDGSISNGKFNQITTPSISNNTFTYNINKTAAQLANLELEVSLNEPTTANDAVYEVEIEVVLTSSSSSSSSCSSSFSSSSSSSSSSCDSAFSSSSSSFSSSSSSESIGNLGINPDSDISTTGWTVQNAPTFWEALDDFAAGDPARNTDNGFALAANTLKLGFKDPNFAGTCYYVRVKFSCLSGGSQGTIGMSLYDGAVQIGSEQIFAPPLSPAGWGEYSYSFATTKTAAELSDMEVWFRWISGLSNLVSSVQIDIGLTSSSSSSQSSSSSSSSFSSTSTSSSSCSGGTGWVTHFANDSTGWSCQSNCSSSPAWTVAGPGMRITEQGTWTDSYRPLKIRVSATHNIGGTWSLSLKDTSNNTIASLNVPNGGSDTANIDWSNNLDIDDIWDNDAPTGQITNIEFFECP